VRAVVIAALAAALASPPAGTEVERGGVVRGPRAARRIALLFTGHEHAEGGTVVLDALARHQARASFFLTGDFLRNPELAPLVRRMIAEGHVIGPHSDRHLLYCAWEDRRTLVTRDAFHRDLAANLREIARFTTHRPRYFEPPYEWWNEEIAGWTEETGLRVVGFTRGTRSNADYTGEADARFVSSEAIVQSVLDREGADAEGLNGFLLLMHVGAGPGRRDKMHARLDGLLAALAGKGYAFVTLDEMFAAGRN
jgi:peptidoglycan/xylan/chitin deacetylase (PgdA/CDA1 family)